MRSLRVIPCIALMGLLTTTAALAKPCNVGTTTGSTGQTSSNDTSSKADGDATGKVTPGAKAESPGTVGAMNNVGSNAMPSANEAKAPEGKVVRPGSDDC